MWRLTIRVQSKGGGTHCPKSFYHSFINLSCFVCRYPFVETGCFATQTLLHRLKSQKNWLLPLEAKLLSELMQISNIVLLHPCFCSHCASAMQTFAWVPMRQNPNSQKYICHGSVSLPPQHMRTKTKLQIACERIQHWKKTLMIQAHCCKTRLCELSVVRGKVESHLWGISGLICFFYILQ